MRNGCPISVAILCWGLSLASVGMASEDPAGAPPSSEEAFIADLGDDGVQRATITLDSYSFTPSHVVVRVGMPVELTLTSVTVITPHNFVLQEPDAGFTIEENIGAGDTEVVSFTPTVPGLYTFYCDKKLLFFASHREKGMEGRLEVRE